MKKYMFAAAAAALFAASPAAAAGFKGVVVAKSGGSLAVATPAGIVHKLHGNARGVIHPGSLGSSVRWRPTLGCCLP